MANNRNTPSYCNSQGKPSAPVKVLRTTANWKNLRFYQKADTLYQLTVDFCKRFLPAYGDRTVDQMIQAARSGKQNIVEGSEDGKTSTEMELKLLNVARASFAELREDYQDFINARHLTLWTTDHPRFQGLQDFTKQHNAIEDYEPFIQSWNQEEMANLALTLCYQVDVMMNSYLQSLEKQFITQGGIKERMHAARTGYRQNQDERMRQLEQENPALKAEIQALRQPLTQKDRIICELQQQLAGKR